MGYKQIDISALVDPAIRCSDDLIVNINRKKSLIAGVLFVSVMVIIIILSHSEISALPLCILIIMIIVALIYTIQNLVNRNPVLKVDMTGITFSNKEHYSWNSIDKIIYEKDMSNEGSSYFRFYLKNGMKKEVANDGFLDKPISETASCLNKYLRKKIIHPSA